MKETELFIPVKRFFEEKDYQVKGEIVSADLIAEKDEKLTAVELKLKPSLKLLLQASENTKSCEFSYIALPISTKKDEKKLLKKFSSLLILSGIGLLAINVEKDSCEELIPAREQSVIDAKMRKKVEKEFRSRFNTLSKGGSVGGAAITAYKESALKIAFFLDKIENQEIPLHDKEKKRIPSVLIKLGCCNKTPSILQKNHYNWFERVENGSYKLSTFGREELAKHENILDFFTL
ncbi:MAG: hypothetical protein JXR63_11290 [Spirochaetales bacterium]|nr:hypothetical protein [Spirochaetales bacterium]